MLKNITVFCGSANTCSPCYLELAENVGRVIARQQRVLLYGSGSRGMMGAAAKGAQQAGGRVVGVNTQRFDNGKFPLAVDEYIVTKTMQDRKVMLIERCDACVALPGGVGTLDEITEIYSMAQLGIANKPFGLLNAAHYYDGLIQQLARAHQDNFIKEKDYRRMLVAEDIETLLSLLDGWKETETP